MMLWLYCHKQVKTVTVEKKLNEIVNRLNKTCEERQPDLRAEREERDRRETGETAPTGRRGKDSQTLDRCY